MENTELLIGAAAALRPLLAECAVQGLTLTEADLGELVALRQEALVRTGRLEFSSGHPAKPHPALQPLPLCGPGEFRSNDRRIAGRFLRFQDRIPGPFLRRGIAGPDGGRLQRPRRGSTDLLCGWTLDRLLRWVRDPESLDEEDLL